MLASLLLAGALFVRGEGAAPAPKIRLVPDEAEGVAGILFYANRVHIIQDYCWRSLFVSRGFALLQREAEAEGGEISTRDYARFLTRLSSYEDGTAYQQAVARWKKLDLAPLARQALDYLPPGTDLRADVYLVVKPGESSYALDSRGTSDVLLAVTPDDTLPAMKNAVVHELNHAGYYAAFPSKEAAADMDARPTAERSALRWVSALAEGLAMIAAAGGPDNHPLSFAGAAERKTWDEDEGHFDLDVGLLAAFYRAILAGALPDEASIKGASAWFYGSRAERGPFYTVGWRMAWAIEKAFGREHVAASFCDPRRLFADYNRAAEKLKREGVISLALWPKDVVARMEGGGSAHPSISPGAGGAPN